MWVIVALVVGMLAIAIGHRRASVQSDRHVGRTTIPDTAAAREGGP
jgi:hypothetical protein